MPGKVPISQHIQRVLNVDEYGDWAQQDSSAIGNLTDNEAAGDGSVIALLKRLRTLLSGTVQVAFAGAQSVNATITNTPTMILGSQPISMTPTTLQSNVFKTIDGVNIASDANIWTPANGKKFRLMGGLVSVIGAVGNVTLKDGNSTIFVLPNVAVSTPLWLNLGEGILSTANNNILKASGVALQVLNGTVWGIEQ